jgi:hypothetical protein
MKISETVDTRERGAGTGSCLKGSFCFITNKCLKFEVNLSD